MPSLSLHFFEERQALAFIETCQSMGIHGSHQRTKEAPRHHVRVECQDEKSKRLLVEEWGRRSVEHG